MPFTKKERRKPMLLGKLKDPQMGDYCYVDYKYLLDNWRSDNSWTTVDRLYMIVKRWNYRSMDLAWQVFFALHVLPYEIKKREENGEC